MKDFRKLLRSKDGITVIPSPFGNITSRKFEAIELGNYSLSIQASENHYCDPRETLYDIYEYNEMEVAIFKNNEWDDINNDEFFYDWVHYREFLEYYDGMVGSYVPVEIIQSLFEFIAVPLVSPVEDYLNFLFFEGDDL